MGVSAATADTKSTSRTIGKQGGLAGRRRMALRVVSDDLRAFNQFISAFLSALTLSIDFRLEKILWRMLA
jgi:hypothetical protein